MVDRAYTLKEIDIMRTNLYQIRQNTCEPIRLPGKWWVNNVSYEEEQKLIWEGIEDRLRTYMMGGVDPQDIEEELEESKEIYKGRYAEAVKTDAEYNKRLKAQHEADKIKEEEKKSLVKKWFKKG